MGSFSVLNNIAGINAQNQLNINNVSLSKTMLRLSSGKRINSGGDDAAGLGIADSLRANVRALNQAVRNANDGISLAQTGEGALQESTNLLQRMREIAVQARNATNSASDRASLDAEFQELLAEVDRIATTTAFNGTNILNGDMGNAVFQVGANVGETIAVDLSTSMRTNAIGGYATVNYQVTESNDTTGQAGQGMHSVRARYRFFQPLPSPSSGRPHIPRAGRSACRLGGRLCRCRDYPLPHRSVRLPGS